MSAKQARPPPPSRLPAALKLESTRVARRLLLRVTAPLLRRLSFQAELAEPRELLGVVSLGHVLEHLELLSWPRSASLERPRVQKLEELSERRRRGLLLQHDGPRAARGGAAESKEAGCAVERAPPLCEQRRAGRGPRE